MPTIGVVGLGLLGHAVAARLLRTGHVVIGFDVLPEKVAALQALGGQAAASAAAVAQGSEAVCTLLPSLATAESAIVGRHGVLAGAHTGLAVVQMSTISPTLTEKLARSVTARPVLESVLPRAVLVGRVAQAMTLKLVANLLVALHSAAAAEALTLARKAGLDLDIALEVLNSSAAASGMLKVRGPMIVRGEFPAQMKLELFMKDLHLMQEAAAAVGAPLPFTDLAERLYGAARAAGHGGEDLAVVVSALETFGGRGAMSS